MQKIIFNDDTELNIRWIGLSDIDDVLRIGIPNMDLISAVELFSDINKTSIINHEFDGDGITTNTYTGFIELVSVIAKQNGVEVGLKEQK